jgi:hypothetical protein
MRYGGPVGEGGAPIASAISAGCAYSAGPIDHRTKTEHLATILLPNLVAAYTQADLRWTSSPKSPKKTKPCRTGCYRLKWMQPHFECGAFDHSRILEAAARTRSSDARHLLDRSSLVGEAEFVFMAYYAKTDIPYEDTVGHWRASGSRCKIAARLKVDRD